MIYLLELLFGTVIGAAVIGSSIARTTAVQKKNFRDVTSSSALNSVAYFASIYFVAAGHYAAYAGTALGGYLVCLYMIRSS